MSVMIKRRLLMGVVILLLVGATTIVSRPPAHGVQGTLTKQELQAANLRKDRCYVVTNAGTDGDCDATAGNGTIVNICCSNGTSWQPIGDGAGAGSYDLDFAGDSGTGAITDGETMTLTGGQSITTTALVNDLSIAVTANSIDQVQLSGTIDLADGDELNLSAITPDSADEGLILPQKATCDGAVNQAGNICYQTGDDALCVFDGSAWDCQVLGAAGGVTTTTVRELLPSTEWVIPQTGGAQEVVFGSTFPRTFLNFNDESADESIYLETHLPTGYRTGDAFTATVAWSTTATTGSNPGEQACWCLSAVDVPAGLDIDAAADETQCSDSSPTATANQRRTTLITMTQGSYTGGRALVLRLFRDEDSGDSNCEGAELTVDVRFHGLLLTYGLDL